MNKPKRIGLALGGGGARGFAHLGVLRALEKAGIPIAVYSGTSMGAILGAAFLQTKEFKKSHRKVKNFVINYAQKFSGLNYVETDKKPNTNLFETLGRQFSRGKTLYNFLRHSHLEDESLLENIARDFIYPCNIEDLTHKMYICSIDFKTGQAVFFNEGDCRKAVMASMSIPGYFPPQKFNDRLLYDAQAVYPVPIQVFEHEPVDLIISVDVGLPIEDDFQVKTGVDLLFRQNDMLYTHVLSEVENCSDLVIRPDIKDVHWTEFHKMDKVILKGMEAANDMIPQVKKMMDPNYNPTPMDERPWHNSGFGDMQRVHFMKVPSSED